jgi:hypothetical protein
MSLDKFARKILSKFHSNSSNIHKIHIRKLLLENKIIFLKFGPKAHLSRPCALPRLAKHGPRPIRPRSSCTPMKPISLQPQLTRKWPVAYCARAALPRPGPNLGLGWHCARPPGPKAGPADHRFIPTVDPDPTAESEDRVNKTFPGRLSPETLSQFLLHLSFSILSGSFNIGRDGRREGDGGPVAGPLAGARARPRQSSSPSSGPACGAQSRQAAPAALPREHRPPPFFFSSTARSRAYGDVLEWTRVRCSHGDFFGCAQPRQPHGWVRGFVRVRVSRYFPDLKNQIGVHVVLLFFTRSKSSSKEPWL